MLPCGCTVSLQSPPSLTVLSDFLFVCFLSFFGLFVVFFQHSIPTYYACILLLLFFVFFVFSLYMYTRWSFVVQLANHNAEFLLRHPAVHAHSAGADVVFGRAVVYYSRRTGSLRRSGPSET